MNKEKLTPLLTQITDGYVRWQNDDRRRRKRRHLSIVAFSLCTAVAVDVAALSLPHRYSSYAGSYGPDAVALVDQMLQSQ